MSKVRDPRTKKRLSLKRDHRVLKLAQEERSRKKLLLEKAAAHQKVRRAEHAALHAALAAPEAAEFAVRAARLASKGTLEKVAAVTLAQHLDIKAGKLPRGRRSTRSSSRKARTVKARGSRASSARI